MRAAAVTLAALLGLGCSGSGSDDGDCNYIGVVPLDFGAVEVGLVGGASLPLQIADLGHAPINLEGIGVTGADAGNFTVAPGQAQQLLPGGPPASVEVTFVPSSIGEQQAELNLIGDSCTRTVGVRGLGVSPSFGVDAGAGACTPAQATLAFGNVVVGETLTLPLVIDNCTPVFFLLGGDIVGSNPTEFSLTGPALVDLGPGQVETASVTYGPTSAGLATAEVPFAVCAGCTSMAVSLTGTGLP